VSISDIADGTGTTFMVGERSRNVSDSTWIGVPWGYGSDVTKPTWSNPNVMKNASFMIQARTGPFPGCDAGTATNANPEGQFMSRAIPPDPRIGTPNRKDAGPNEYNSMHPGGCNFLFCDGTVRFLKDQINPQIFADLATRAGGEPISADQF
jgi:prepilin-type processing-associated H-X9-DG protein